MLLQSILQKFSRNVLSALALIFGALLLASCVTEVQEIDPVIDPVRPGICTREYAPVCASLGSRERTFANSCEARRAGWRIEGRGECEQIIVDPRPKPEPRLCPQIYQPVCATRNSRTRTFGNSCEADASGWRVVGRGECEDVVQPVIERCPRNYQPVCATRDGRARTFVNSCVADSDGWRVVGRGTCEEAQIEDGPVNDGRIVEPRRPRRP